MLVNFTQGENITLTCATLGRPTPTIWWLHNGRQVEGERKATTFITDSVNITTVNITLSEYR